MVTDRGTAGYMHGLPADAWALTNHPVRGYERHRPTAVMLADWITSSKW
jgi:hypothetical protein